MALVRNVGFNLNVGFISLIFRNFSLPFQPFYLGKVSLDLPFAKNFENLRETSYENKQNKPNIQVIKNFSLPHFASFTKNNPVLSRYKKERKEIQRLYKSKDFVDFTLELLTKN